MAFLKFGWIAPSLLLSLSLLVPTGLAGQQLQPGPSLRSAVEAPPLGRVAAGTLLGGVAGAVALGGGGYLLGSSEDEDYLSERQLLGALGVVVGYPLGAALGAHLAARVGDRRPGFVPVYLASAAGAVLGGLVWSIVESGPPSFYSGAAVGIATHVAVTSLVTVRLGTRAR
jgi:hypothetical protein